jgi:hypothetical protein
MKPPELQGLPGAELVQSGIQDWGAEEWTTGALLVAIAWKRFRALGFELHEPPGGVPQHPELELYDLLSRSRSDDPYFRYNSLLRELDSFLEAATARQRGASD